MERPQTSATAVELRPLVQHWSMNKIHLIISDISWCIENFENIITLFVLELVQFTCNWKNAQAWNKLLCNTTVFSKAIFSNCSDFLMPMGILGMLWYFFSYVPRRVEVCIWPCENLLLWAAHQFFVIELPSPKKFGWSHNNRLCFYWC